MTQRSPLFFTGTFSFYFLGEARARGQVSRVIKKNRPGVRRYRAVHFPYVQEEAIVNEKA